MAKIICSLLLFPVFGILFAGGAPSEFDIDNSIKVFTGHVLEAYSLYFNGFVVSPLSLYIGLSLIAMGASGDTADELLFELSIDIDDRQKFSDAMLGLLQTFDADNPTITYDCKVFINETDVKDDFINLIATGFKSDMQPVDYNDLPNTFNIIHQWVMDKLANGSINTGFLGTYFKNDLYMASMFSFNAEWETAFAVENTTIGTFVTTNGEEIAVEMMYLEDSFHYIADENGQYVQLNYTDSNWTMTIMLPFDLTGSQKHNNKELSYGNIRKVVSSMRDAPVTYVKLTLPKFNASLNEDLSEIAALMDLLIFDANANFSNMLNDHNKVASSQNFVKLMVNEWGSGTGLNVKTSTDTRQYGRSTYNRGDIVEFTANRTFFYYVTNRNDDCFYDAFLGVLTNPANATYVDDWFAKPSIGLE